MNNKFSNLLKIEFQQHASKYFNTASVGLPPESALKKIKKHISNPEKVGDIIDVMNMHLEARKSASRIINTTPENIALTPNTSWGIGIALHSINLKKEDEIIIPENSFPSLYYSTIPLIDRGINVKLIKSNEGYVSPDDIKKNISKNTMCVIISWVNFKSGIINPAEEIANLCKEKDIILIVDGIQIVGTRVVNIEDTGIDFLAVGGQKWLLSPAGCGFLYISNDLRSNITPPFTGWLSVDRGERPYDLTNYDYKFYPDARVFEVGTLPNALLSGFARSISLLEEVELKNIHIHSSEICKTIAEELSSSGFNLITPENHIGKTSIISFEIDEERKHIMKTVMGKGYTFTLREDYVRFSPHLYTSKEMAQELIREIRSLV
ncbi:MAG: hypothetical protein DRH49_02855 [Candidatus Coatesbacteria bacterium]|nr:MAG: hypothetical protein DRH49_02855 [Candidatus Coatesbacteria bacterium]